MMISNKDIGLQALILLICGWLTVGSLANAEDAPAVRLMTRWGEEVTPENVHPEYPRPQMTRPRWKNLNGEWDYAILPRGDNRPEKYQGKLLVPFPVESTLSGVTRRIGATQRLWYRRLVSIPSEWKGERIVLHFGAVDWEATVWVNGKMQGSHRGGYAPFSFDITEAVDATADQQEVVVAVWDPTDTESQPRGKQRNQPGGIWYTPVTGIWQTVWLEPVAPLSVTSLHLVPDLDRRTLSVTVQATHGTDHVVRIAAPQLACRAQGKVDQPIVLSLPECTAWSPGDPQLYDLHVELLQEGAVVDQVASYFAMRKIEVKPDQNGIPRIHLNNEPLFQYGTLDQGWWPDGLYTAPRDKALRYDLEVTQRLGFNMVRKHVKIEPQRWYWHCDQMGLLVWQDMPNGGQHAPWPRDGHEIERSKASRSIFANELEAMVVTCRNHPSVVAWVPFNEAWGQFETVYWTEWLQEFDPTRLVVSASGGNDFGVGDVHDIHQYPGPEAPPAEDVRAAVLGEFGGLGLPLPGHTWQDEKNWGYRQFKTQAALQQAYLDLMQQLRPLIESRLSAAIYTQTTDVEVEVNGLMTYDRRKLKFDAQVLAAAHQKLYAPLRPLTASELSAAYTVAYWRFEEGKPGDLVPHDRQRREAVAARDVSGHGNHVYAFAAGNAPRHTADVPAATVPRLGLPNRGALDDTAMITGPTRDLFTNPGRSRTHMNAVNTFPFQQWTVELSVKPVEMGRLQALVGEDGRPTQHPQAPFQIQLRPDGRAQVTAIDASGTVRQVASRKPLALGQWHHLVALSDGREMRLIVNDGQGYALQGSSPFPGGMIRHDGTWTIGRGFDAGKITHDARAVIDEVRVSAIALPQKWWLWSRTP